MRRKMRSALLLVVCQLFGSIAFAASYQGLISNVTPYNNLVFISVGSGGFDGPASTCSTNSGNAMIYSFDPSIPVGKAMLAAALGAKLSGKIVYIYGSNTCLAEPNPYNGAQSETLTNVGAQEFESNLVSNGYSVVSRMAGSNGDVIQLANGASRWTIYTRSSTGFYGAQYFGANGAIVKYSLGGL